MTPIRRPLRWLRLLVASLLLLASCSRPPSVYSRNPVDEEGVPFREQTLTGLELADHTRYELGEGETLTIEAGVLVIRGKVRADGSRRQRLFDLDEVELLRVQTAPDKNTWYPVGTPADLAQFDVLPKLERITLLDGETIEVDRETRAHWSANHLEILVGPKTLADKDLRVLSMDEVETVQLATTNPLRATLLAPQFWIVAGAAAGLAWFLAGRENSDNTAVE